MFNQPSRSYEDSNVEMVTDFCQEMTLRENGEAA